MSLLTGLNGQKEVEKAFDWWDNLDESQKDALLDKWIIKYYQEYIK